MHTQGLKVSLCVDKYIGIHIYTRVYVGINKKTKLGKGIKKKAIFVRWKT